MTDEEDVKKKVADLREKVEQLQVKIEEMNKRMDAFAKYMKELYDYLQKQQSKPWLQDTGKKEEKKKVFMLTAVATEEALGTLNPVRRML